MTFSTYLGARDYDSVAAIAVDRDGNAYLTGSTRSSDFPATPGAYETVFKPYFEFLIALGSGCPFVTKLNQNGSALVYSTFLTSTQTLGANDIALDSAGNAYIASGGYISKLDPSGSALRFSEYFRAGWLPLDSWYFRTGWLALDSSENIYSAGGATLKPPGRRNSSEVIVDLPILWVSLIKLSSSDSIPFFLPVVLSVPGLNGSYFTSELTLTNSGASSAPLEIEYRATVGGGSGTGAITLRPGTQQIFPDAMGFLSSLGIPVPTSGDRLGSLIIRAPKDVAVQARTTTRTGPGRAGLASPSRRVPYYGQLIHYLMGVLTMLAAYALGTRLFTRSAGLVAMAVLASSPLFLWEMRTVHVDVGLALYVFASLYATAVWLSKRDKGWYWLVICFLGFSLGIKYHGCLRWVL